MYHENLLKEEHEFMLTEVTRLEQEIQENKETLDTETDKKV